jgi:hypothetical protein
MKYVQKQVLKVIFYCSRSRSRSRSHSFLRSVSWTPSPSRSPARKEADATDEPPRRQCVFPLAQTTTRYRNREIHYHHNQQNCHRHYHVVSKIDPFFKCQAEKTECI